MKKRLLSALAILSLASGALGQTPAPAPRPTEPVAAALAPATTTPKEATAGTNSPAAKENGSVKMINAAERDFKPRDIFRFSIKEDPAPSQASLEAMVTDAGEVHFLVSGQFSEYVTVDVRGKKLAEIRSDVKRMLDERYYQNASITLDLASINVNSSAAATSGMARARVFGELNGTIALPDGEEVWLSDALIGLGRNEMANLRKVKLQRKDPATGANKSFEVNVEKILKTNARNLDIKLQDGDRIEVPARTVLF
jgi:protein involved in polysaccharide export with SLBB domain